MVLTGYVSQMAILVTPCLSMLLEDHLPFEFSYNTPELAKSIKVLTDAQKFQVFVLDEAEAKLYIKVDLQKQ